MGVYTKREVVCGLQKTSKTDEFERLQRDIVRLKLRKRTKNMEEIEKQQKKIDSFFKTCAMASLDKDYKKIGLCYFGIGTCMKKIKDLQLEHAQEIEYIPENPTPDDVSKYI